MEGFAYFHLSEFIVHYKFELNHYHYTLINDFKAKYKFNVAFLFAYFISFVANKKFLKSHFR